VGVWRRLSAIVLALTACQIAAEGWQRDTDRTPCSFSASEVDWVQRALAGWEQVSREFLKLDPEPLPWIVLFDSSCVWHLAADSNPADSVPVTTALVFAGRPVPVRSVRHNGTILLPSDVPIAVELKASSALYRNSRAAFFVMPTPSVWRTRDVSAPTRAEFLQGVFSHEMSHTRLLIAINRRVRELTRKHDLVYPITDDVIQAEFRKVPGFEAAFNRERDQFYKAALAADPARRRELTIKALGMARRRQARYFKGSTEAYRELENLFLTIEGVGQWAAYRLIQSRAGTSNAAEALRVVRGNRRYWSQEQGLALFLLVDAMVLNWQARVFTSAPASPFALLEEAIQ
jgi:hypothetical protein